MLFERQEAEQGLLPCGDLRRTRSKRNRFGGLNQNLCKRRRREADRSGGLVGWDRRTILFVLMVRRATVFVGMPVAGKDGLFMFVRVLHHLGQCERRHRSGEETA